MSSVVLFMLMDTLKQEALTTARKECVWRSNGIAPLILNLGTPDTEERSASRSGRFEPREGILGGILIWCRRYRD